MAFIDIPDEQVTKNMYNFVTDRFNEILRFNEGISGRVRLGSELVALDTITTARLNGVIITKYEELLKMVLSIKERKSIVDQIPYTIRELETMEITKKRDIDSDD